MRVGVQEGHAAWADVYDEAPNPALALERRTVEPWLGSLRGTVFLDVACGTGRWGRFAAQQGARVVGADFCAPMVHRAVEGAGSCQQLVLADALRLPFRDRFADVSVCAFAAGYLASPSALLAELKRVTADGGRVLVTDLHPAAIRSGWRRSFRRAGEVYEIDHRAHPVAEYLECAREFGLALEHLAEPAFGEPERAIFRERGAEDRFDAVCRVSAIFAALWRVV
jgi:ubiquinone/menaquinone biosynthesis C-methylase UbiE